MIRNGQQKGTPKGESGGPVASSDQLRPDAAKSTALTSRARAANRRESGDALEKLIDDAIREPKMVSNRGGPSEKTAPDDRLGSLSHEQIQAGMRRIKGKVTECYERFRVAGTATLRITIGPRGAVTSAQVKGMFSGTPTGACLEAALTLAEFPPFRGPAVTVTYPFILR